MKRCMLIWLLTVCSLSAASATGLESTKLDFSPGPWIGFGQENTIPGEVFEARAGLTPGGMIQFITVEQGLTGNDIKVRQHPYNSFGEGMTTRSLDEGNVYEVKGPQYDLDSVIYYAVDADAGFNIREYDYLESTDQWLNRLVSTTTSYNAVSADAGQVLGVIYLVVQNFDNNALEFSHRNPMTGAYTHVATYRPGEIANVFDGATNVTVGTNPMSLSTRLSYSYQTMSGDFNVGLFDPKDNSFESINIDNFSLTKGANANLLLDGTDYYKGYYDRNGEAVIFTVNKMTRQVVTLSIGSEPIGNSGFLANIAPGYNCGIMFFGRQMIQINFSNTAFREVDDYFDSSRIGGYGGPLFNMDMNFSNWFATGITAQFSDSDIRFRRWAGDWQFSSGYELEPDRNMFNLQGACMDTFAD